MLLDHGLPARRSSTAPGRPTDRSSATRLKHLCATVPRPSRAPDSAATSARSAPPTSTARRARGVSICTRRGDQQRRLVLHRPSRATATRAARTAPACRSSSPADSLRGQQRLRLGRLLRSVRRSRRPATTGSVRQGLASCICVGEGMNCPRRRGHGRPGRRRGRQPGSAARRGAAGRGRGRRGCAARPVPRARAGALGGHAARRGARAARPAARRASRRLIDDGAPARGAGPRSHLGLGAGVRAGALPAAAGRLRLLGSVGAEAGRAGARHRPLGQPVRSDGRRKVPGAAAARSVAGRARHPSLRRQRARRAPLLRALRDRGADGDLLGRRRPPPQARRPAGDAGARHDAALRAGGAAAHLGRAAHRRAGAGAGRARPLRLAARRSPPRRAICCSASSASSSASWPAARCRASCCRSWR